MTWQEKERLEKGQENEEEEEERKCKCILTSDKLISGLTRYLLCSMKPDSENEVIILHAFRQKDFLDSRSGSYI